MKKLYPLADAPTNREREAIGFPPVGGLLRHFGLKSNVRAIATGERRPPKKGEWYLSGAIVEAYRAPNDFSIPYHIAKLVRVRITTTTTIEQI